MTEACRQVVADQEVALTAVAEYAQQPGNVDVANIEAARDRLRGELANVPAEIQPHVQTQVDILSGLVDGLRTGNPSNVDVNQLRDAAQQVADMCQTNR